MIDRVKKARNGGLGLIWEGEKGTTIVVEPQLTTMDHFEWFHVDASEKINMAWAV